MTVNQKTFHLKGENACISGRKNKDRYMEYQDEYRKQYGVFPELDRINRPFTALWDDVYNLMCELRRPGINGALYYHDLHARFRKRLKKIYATYSYEWSFLISIDLDNRTIFTEIPAMEPSEHIVNDLGWRKDEQGNYYEGTWKNGKLIYGLVYLANSGAFYVGSYDESGRSTCTGVSVDLDQKNRGKRQITTTAGCFKLTNGTLSLYDSICLVNSANIKNDELVSVECTVGQFANGYAEGIFFDKELSDDIRIGWDKYRDGEVKSSMSAIEVIPRTLMMFYMLFWYFVKYVHGSVFLVTPLYYYFRKKSWKI